MLRSVFQLGTKSALRSWTPTGSAYAVHLRSFCTDGSGIDLKDGIRAVTAALSAARYGPLAVQKIMAMSGSSSSSRTWPAGKKVKVVFQEMNTEEKPKNFAWMPEEKYLYEVIMKQTAMGDFTVSYKDEAEEPWELDTTKADIDRWLAENMEHPSPVLQVEWRPLTLSERAQSELKVVQSRVQKAINWMTGEGAATDQAVKDAQDEVEKKGGKITVSSGSGRSLIDHKGYNKADWPEVVKGLQAELNLSDEDAAALLNAGLRDEGKAVNFRENNSGNKMTIEFIAYHTVCHGDKIDVVYGKHTESMEVSGEMTALPLENCIQYKGSQFAAWPPASPHSTQCGADMEGLRTELPPGWKLVDSTQEDFDNIRTRVIAPYGWHTNVLVTIGEDGKLEGWNTARFCTPGEFFFGDSCQGVQKKGASSFEFTSGSGSWRLLIQAHPSANHELINNWKRYAQLSAQREWCQRLGMIPGGSIE